MNVDALFAPSSYGPLWWIIAAVLGLLLVAWAVVMPIVTKRHAQKLVVPPPPAQPLAMGQMDPLRQEYRSRIEQLAARREAQEITERALHLSLSNTLREYVKLRMGLRADVMTLTELRADLATSEIADVIERCYHPAFAQGSAADAASLEPVERAVTVRVALNVVDRI